MTTQLPTLFVTGATGQLGQLVIDSLLARVPAGTIIAGVRATDSEPAQRLTSRGIGLRVADYDRPETLRPALEGVDRLLLISSSAVGRRVDQHQHVIDAARGAGVALIAYTSILHADTSPFSLAEEHRPTEAALKASGVPFVLLRNGWYIENYEAAIRASLTRGTLLGSAGNGRVAAASRTDYAQAAAVVLTEGGHAGETYELAGDRGFTLAELSAMISETSGKAIGYRDLPESEFQAALIAEGQPDKMAGLFASVDTGIACGGLDERSGALGRLIGRPTTPIRDFVAQVVAGQAE